MNIDIIAEISDRDAIVVLKDTITKYKVKVSSRSYRRIGIA